MKKITTKRTLTQLLHSQLAQKPYGFCCEEKDQDPDKHYDMRNPPFMSSLTDVILDGGGPGVIFRISDTGRPSHVSQLRRILAVKGMDYLGRCRRCRGPLKWYLEDEIASARETIAKEKQNNHNARVKTNLKIAKQKSKKRRSYIKRIKSQKSKIPPKLEATNNNQLAE